MTRSSFWLKRRNRWLVLGGSLALLTAGGVLAAVLLFSQPPPIDTRPTYPDLPADNPDFAAVTAMISYGLMTPAADGSFQPTQALTRAELARLLATVLQLGQNRPLRPTFSDVLANHTDYAAVEATKVYFGYPASPAETAASPEPAASLDFGPEQPVLRQQATAVLVRALALQTGGQPDRTVLADHLQLAADDPLRSAAAEPFTRLDAARLFSRLIASRLPSPAPTFAIRGIR